MGAGERGTRVELGVVGIGKRVGTRLRRRRESEEEGERERQDTTDGGWWLQPWDEDQFFAHRRKEKTTPRW